MPSLFSPPLFIVAALSAAACLGGQVRNPRLTLPREGATIANNMPSLSWSPTGADQVEVWIDDFKVALLPGDATRYVPFPLSFGPHRWKVVSISGTRRRDSLAAHFTIDDAPLASLPENAVLLRHNWLVQSSEVVGTDGARLASPGVDASGWAATSVPATVLTALVRNGIYPNPYAGLNNTRIPDASDPFNAAFNLLRFSHLPGHNPWSKPYWYRTAFALPPTYAGKRVWLTFNEINYRAEVWLNGRRIANPEEMVGMDRTFRFDVTSFVRRDGDNCLAVEIYPLDAPGLPAPPPVTPLADPGANMGDDARISENYTKWDTIGWDWQPEVHDRDMGITEDVFLSATDDVELSDVYAASMLPVPDLSHADVLLGFDIGNHASEPRNGVVEATILDGGEVAARVEQPFAIGANASSHIDWTAASEPALHLAHPRLWWPAGMGEPSLYTVRLELRTTNGDAAIQTVRLGIRRIDTSIDPVSGCRVFRVNGRPLFAQGGNWVTDMMLNWTASRYTQEIQLTRQARLNFLRIWGPTGTPPEAFYDAADRCGILLQQDFLNDNWGTQHNAPGNAPPLDLVEKATSAIIKKARNHPSVFLWCGGNEGPNPREQLIAGTLLQKLDPWGGRHYLTGSNEDGLQGGGPYDNLPPEAYFGNPKLTGFNSEVGPSGIPEWESLQQFLTFPPTVWAPSRFPLDGQWAYHDATDRPGESESRKFSHLDDVLRHRFGAPTGTDLAAARAYVEKAQMLNFDTYRAVIESLNQTLGTKTVGFALWKANSSWPSVVWQIYDWYEQCHAGFYAVRRACEPVHVQFNSDDRTISVVNRTDSDANALRLHAELYDARMHSRWTENMVLDAPSRSNTAAPLPVPPQKELAFLKLRLLDARGKPVSDNLYWIENDSAFPELAGLSGAGLEAHVKTASEEAPGCIHVTLTNRGSSPALLVRAQWTDRDSGAEILPTFWSDNYVSLLPGETVGLDAKVPAELLPKHSALLLSPNNIATRSRTPF